MSKSKKSATATKTVKVTGPGKGHFQATLLTFTGTDGAEHQYGGRGRYSVPLAMLVVANGQVPMRTETGWQWRDADADELASSQELVQNVANRIMEKAAAKIARAAAREQRKALKAAKVTKVAKVKKVKAVDVPVITDVPVESPVEGTPVVAE